ncbi:DUF6171 family protein [Enterococcus sp. DIV0876]|uniref:DUF6171 family protein n=1 Tax=Enterococcus sp. DIV0876 TaxID=2774633 RepID=UPI003D2FE746
MTCKGCDIKDEAATASAHIDQLIAEQLEMEIDLSMPEVAANRIAICEACPLRINHTCSKCGCFYKFRANLAHKNCPVGKWLE